MVCGGPSGFAGSSGQPDHKWYNPSMGDWQVQEAKAELSALISESQREPQIITRHGEPVAVVISYSQFQSLKAQQARPTLFAFLRTWPEMEIPERDNADFGRSIEIS